MISKTFLNKPEFRLKFLINFASQGIRMTNKQKAIKATYFSIFGNAGLIHH